MRNSKKVIALLLAVVSLISIFSFSASAFLGSRNNMIGSRLNAFKAYMTAVTIYEIGKALPKMKLDLKPILEIPVKIAEVFLKKEIIDAWQGVLLGIGGAAIEQLKNLYPFLKLTA